MACLHEGVFLNRSHAEQYISIFSPQVDPFQNDGPRSACKPEYDVWSGFDNCETTSELFFLDDDLVFINDELMFRH